MTTKYTFFIVLFVLTIGICASDIPNIPQCNNCFNSLPKGCMEKISNSSTNTTTAQTAYQDCLCTKQYIDNFINCATCSAKSMNSDQIPTEKDKSDAMVTCSSLGFPIQVLPTATPNPTGSSPSETPSVSSTTRPESTVGPRTNSARTIYPLDLLVVNSGIMLCLGMASRG
ncbi:hypothetical protein K493DRAFT_307387 [Basidiobolus meristosporus CBS 931.73]|uniref:Uncharacterized protein n=1 Tax=Basidiobolus meristosporus CBS 931.73 TaxID=1314790 RepID=A0A1Y1XG96_9FUNG|nr:hypothetical protein K493DRAFT_307387 [Basidiobolus meristosporus CBS 931.73]|eukprot:ORX84780.1 hypothetical protein K493DRAFT_307387 [Basidiobolus meristosporus CBS 931.73]